MDTLEDLSKMPFGKHSGKFMQDVPARYLIWLWNNGLKSETKLNSKGGMVARYIKKSRNALAQECPDMEMD